MYLPNQQVSPYYIFDLINARLATLLYFLTTTVDSDQTFIQIIITFLDHSKLNKINSFSFKILFLLNQYPIILKSFNKVLYTLS